MPRYHTIFVVDDDPSVVEILRNVLTNRDRYVLGFTDPLRALAALTVTPPDLMIVDLWMPQMDGETFMKVARTRVPALVMIISGVDNSTALDIAERFNAPVLVKPFELSEIRRLVDSMLK